MLHNFNKRSTLVGSL